MQMHNNKTDNQQHHSQAGHAEEPKSLDGLLNLYNLGIEDEAWQKIVKALAARGFPIKDEDFQANKG